IVVGLDIELPQQVFLPWSEHLVVHRFDISVGDETQHSKVVDVSDEIGKLADDGLIAEIASKNDFRHLEMVLDRKNYLLHLIFRKLQISENDLHTFSTGMHMIAFVMTMCFADVVKKQRQQ